MKIINNKLLFVVGLMLMGGCFMHKQIQSAALTEKDFVYDNFHVVREGCLYRSGQIPAVRIKQY
ncbi:hypothetical protein FJ364_02470, partial [Candidatus Dependentiae bacterium]|nr:hypothetical protein [Candidatus Dependentiae bacterium]